MELITGKTLKSKFISNWRSYVSAILLFGKESRKNVLSILRVLKEGWFFSYTTKCLCLVNYWIVIKIVLYTIIIEGWEFMLKISNLLSAEIFYKLKYNHG